MTLILVTKWSAILAVLLVMLLIFCYSHARAERGDAVGNWGAFTIIIFFLLVVAVIVLVGCSLAYFIVSPA